MDLAIRGAKHIDLCLLSTQGILMSNGKSLIPEHQGTYYVSWMHGALAALNARNYFEIGSRDGGSLQQVKVPSIAVDPHFQLDRDCMGAKPMLCLYQIGSDEFFRKYDPRQIFGAPIDFAFLDGLHLFEFLLRDFLNTERFCRPNSIICLHDCLPTTVELASRREPPQSAWTGDVWKMVAILGKYRKDIKMYCLDCPPTGLVVCTCLAPESQVLGENYFEIVQEFREAPDDGEKLRRLYSTLPIHRSADMQGMYEASKYFWL